MTYTPPARDDAIGLRPDLDGTGQSGVWTLSATPGTVTSIALPDAARIVTVRPSADVQIRLNADPAAIGSGAFADADLQEAVAAFADLAQELGL